MTREEAKKRLEVWLICAKCPEDKKCYDSYLHSICEYTDYCDEVPIEEAVKVAIKVLEQEPCGDAISRKAAINAIWDGVNMDIYTREVKETLEALPSVTVEDIKEERGLQEWEKGSQANN